MWFRRKPKPPAAEPPEPKPKPKPKPSYTQKPKNEGIEVTEVDTRDMSATGVFKAWKRLTGRDK